MWVRSVGLSQPPTIFDRAIADSMASRATHTVTTSVLRKVSRNSLVVVISADAEIACRSIGFPTASGDRLAQSLLRIRHISRRTGSITHAIAASPRESGPIPYAEALPPYSVHPEGTVFVSAPQARVRYWIGLRN